MKIAKIIITEQPIPYPKNGSWTQRLEYYLKTKDNIIDYFICGQTADQIETKTIFFREKQLNSKVLRKFFPYLRYQNYCKRLLMLAQQHDQVIACVVDNVKLMLAVSQFIDDNKLKNKITLLFYCCGHSYFLDETIHKKFLKNCNEFIFLTKKGYEFNKERYEEFIPEVTLLNNPIDKSIYKPITPEEKTVLLEKHTLSGKKIFLWLSHDREKKGLDIVLNAWKDARLYEKDAVLLVVGAKRNEAIKGVKFIGQVKNNEVLEYYKIAHIYLFPALWKEGFGLSLAQAICCGCYCIASNNGGVSDFFTTEDGVLIEQPNLVNEWVERMEESLNKINLGWNNKEAGKQILDYPEWSKQFGAIFTKWENRFHKE